MRNLFTLLFTLLFLNIFSQTGAASIGNATGANGQPKNEIWFDANTLGLTNGANVTNWTDNSGNLNDGTQATVANQPTFDLSAINGLPAVVFDGTDDFIPFNGNVLAGTDYTVIIVAQRRSNNNRRLVIGGTASGTNNNLHIYWQNSSNFRSHHWGNDLSTSMDGSSGTNVNEFGIFTTRLRSGDASAQRKNYQNNNLLGSLNNAATLNSWNGAALARFNGPEYHDVDIAEVIIYSTALNDAQLEIVHNYLNVKYGIAITNDRYTEASGYIYNVTGIGNIGGEKQNSSVSAGFYIENQGNSYDDGEFVFCSHNNATNNEANIQTGTNVTNCGAEAAWNRNWYVAKDGVTSVGTNIIFDIPEAFVNGEFPQNINNYVLLYKANVGDDYSDLGLTAVLGDADQLKFYVSNTNLNNGFYTLGTKDQTNSPVQGAPGKTWYTLVSGDWDDSNIWTLDPSGFLPNNPNNYTPTTSPTALMDNVVIKSGKEVVVNSNNKQNNSIEVEGDIDFQSTTGHSFSTIKGGGRIKLSADNFPSGDASNFYTAGEGEGTVRYYGGSYNLNTELEFFNLEIVLDNPTNTLTLTKDYTINGDFLIHTGEFKINDNSSTTILNITAKNNVTIETNGKISTGTGNTIGSYTIGGTQPSTGNYHGIYHQFKIGGNFTNNGSARFTNQADPIYNQFTSTGAVTVIFNNANNATALLNGTTDFYNLIVDKGTDQTYVLTINSTDISNFVLYGANTAGRVQNAPFSAANPEVRKALWVHNGTLKLTGKIYIPTLTEGRVGGVNGDYCVGANACFWIAGANVTVYSTATDNSTSGNTQVNDGSGASVNTSGGHSAMSVYGKFRISDGYFGTKNSYGFVFWNAANAVIQIEGGETDVSQLYSANGGTGIASYIQTGGLLRARGNETEAGGFAGPLFGLTGANAIFNMSGGEILLRDYKNGDTELLLECADGNYNVTGGKVTIDVRENAAGGSNPDVFQISSNPNLWDLEIKNHNNSGNITVEMLTDLKVSHDLTINNYTTLDANTNTKDVYIGRNFSIIEGATYDYGTNTTTFNGTEDGEFYIGHNTDDGYEQYLYNLTVNKTVGKRITVIGDPNKDPNNVSQEYYNRLVHVVNDCEITSGILNQGRQSVRLFAGVDVKSEGQLGTYVNLTTPRTAYVMFRDGDLTVYSENGATFGNIKFNSTGTVTFTSDVYIKRIGFYQGLYNIGTYNLKVDYLHKKSTANNYGGGSVSKMIYGAGNASDGGLSILITENATHTFPIGVSGKYSPAEMTISNVQNSDSGYVTINPVQGELQTTDLTCGGELLDYYWRVDYEGLASIPTVKYEFIYNNADIVGNENNYYPGKVLDGGSYTRSYEQQANVITSNNKIKFNDTGGTSGNTGNGFGIEKANYTAGETCRFVGAPRIYYTRLSNGASWYNRYWEDGNNWSTVPHDGASNNTARPAAGTWPKAGDIAVIGYGGGGSANTYHSITIRNGKTINVAEVRFNNPLSNSDRLVLYRNCNITFSSISGTGGTFMQRIQTGDVQNITGDFNDFYSQSTFTYSYFLDQNGTYNITPPTSTFPNLRVEGNNNRTAIFDKDFTVNWNFTIDGNTSVITNNGANGDIVVKGTLRIGGWQGGNFRFNTSGNSRTVEVKDIWVRNTYNTQQYNISVLNSTPSNLIHKLIVNGNILQECDNGGIDLFTDNTGGNNVILEIKGNGTNNFTKTNSGNTLDLYRIIMNKGTSQTDTFTFKNDFNLEGPTSGAGVAKALEMQNGTLILDDAGIDINLTTGDDDFKIPTTACLEVKQGNVNASGDDSGIKLNGKLLINGGTVNMDDAVNNGNNYIEYGGSGDAELEITSGLLTVGSQIRRGLMSEEGILKYTQSGGTVTIGKNNNPEGNRGVLEVLNTGSEFNFTGGTLSLSNTQTNPKVASLYLDPSSSNIDNTATINLGDVNTNVNQDFGIYSTTALPRLVVNNTSSNNPKATIWIVPLTIDKELDINTNAEFDANGIDLILNGDLTCNGTFTHNQNTTYFRGSTNQDIIGSPVFYNFTKENNTNTLTLNADITIEREFKLLTGILNDNDNTVFVQGDVWNYGTHIWGGTSEGIKLNSTTSNQVLRATGEFGKLTIDNYDGITVPNDNAYEITINDELKMMKGVFNIDKNLLVLKTNAEIIEANAFGEHNMIQTNASFTDAGVKKYFPLIDGSHPHAEYVFPIGSEGKYTPLDMDISNISANGNIRMKAANERQSTIVDDTDEDACCAFDDLLNVLQYHYVLEATGVSNFTGDITMHYKDADALHVNSCGYDESNYIAARLLTYGDNTWIKPLDYTTVDEVNDEILYSLSNVSSNDLSGEYTAGVEQSSGCNGAIPQRVPEYVSAANGNWNVATNWYRLDALGMPITPAGTNVPTNGPYGAIVHIEHTITTTTNYTQSYKTEIRASGVLKVNNTFGHRAGRVTGTGVLYSERAALPAGIYDDFFSSAGGTVEYGGNTNYSILPGINEVNNLTFSGTGERKFQNGDVKLNGDLTINGATIIQENSRTVTVLGDIAKTGGSFEFSNLNTNNIIAIRGTGNHSISGDFSSANNAISNLTINKPSGAFTTNSDIEVRGVLTLTNGIVNSSSSAMIELGMSASVTGASSNSYINGYLYKDILSGSGDNFEFPVGNSGYYRPIGIVGLTLRTQFIANYIHGSQSNSNVVSPLTDVSPNNEWVLNDVNNRHPNSNVKLYWGPETGVVTVADLRVAILNGSTEWENRGGTNFSGTTSSGHLTSSIQSSFSSHHFTIATEGSKPLPVNLVKFNAVAENEAVKINWTTSSETNCDYFIVERSTDGVYFDNIAKVKGAGNSNILLNYLTYDYEPLMGISYYRLTQVDYDGKSETFPMVAVKFSKEEKGNNNYSGNNAQIKIYPNPFSSGRLNVDIFNFADNEDIILSVFDATGKIIFITNTKANKLLLENKLSTIANSVNVGFYYISIKNNKLSATTKLIKTH